MRNCTISFAHGSEKFRRDEIVSFRKAELLCVRGGHDNIQIILRSDCDGEFSFTQLDGPLVDTYIENYTEVTSPTRNNCYWHPLGFYPDALIPYSIAKKHDYLLLKAGENSAIWLDFKGKEAGNGEMRFALTVNGQTEEIILPYAVYPVDLPKASMQTLFLMRKGYIADGEGYCDTDLYRRYFEFLLDYRINTYSLPVSTTDPKELADEAERYFDHPYFVGYGLTSGVRGGGGVYNLPLLKEQIRELAKRSYEGHNLVEKAFLKHGDEPDCSGANMKELTAEEQAIVDTLKEVADEIEAGDYSEFKKIKNWRECIENMQIILPMADAGSMVAPLLNSADERNNLLHVVNAWCVKPDVYDLDMRHLTLRLREKLKPKRPAWWYTCNDPVYPYPSYHIDDNLLGARVMSWMQKRDGIIGNLMWSPVAFDSKCMPLNTSKLGVPYRSGGSGVPAGEGFLMYPGKCLEEQGPFPCMRLMNIRDGMEEYELLGAYEEKYGREKTEELYERVMYGTRFYRDGRFPAVRKVLLQGIAGIPPTLPTKKRTCICDFSNLDSAHIELSQGGGYALNGGLEVTCPQQNLGFDREFIPGIAIYSSAFGGTIDMQNKVLHVTLENPMDVEYVVKVALYGKKSFLSVLSVFLLPGESTFDIYGYDAEWSEKHEITAISLQFSGRKTEEYTVNWKKIELTEYPTE